MKKFTPLDYETFNAIQGKANCMLFAFNKKISTDTSVLDYNLWGFRTTPIKEIVEKAALEFFRIKVRKINSIEEAPDNKYLIGFYLKKPLSEYSDYDYHFIRRELDGTWVEKPNWEQEAKAQKANLTELHEEFNMDPVLFVIEGVL